MQCVKLGFIMGSYLNIHLNLFPIYVLLLLPTLSHGRPSARIREPGHSSSRKFFNLRNNYIFNNNNYSSATYSDRMSLHNLPKDNSYLDFNLNNDLHFLHSENEAATGSLTPRSAAKSKRTLISRNQLSNLLNNWNGKFINLHGPKKTGEEFEISEKYEDQMKNLTSPRSRSERERESNSNQVWKDVEDRIENEKSPTDTGRPGFEMRPWDQSNNRYPPEEELELDGEETEESDDDQQLNKFRMNILKELGFENRDVLNNQRTTAGHRSQHSPLSTLAPKWNISREDYAAAYAQYMFNVRQRKESERKNIGPKRRKKNAVARTYTYYGYASDHEMSDGKGLTTLSFDIDQGKMTQANIRIRKALISIPILCHVTSGSGRGASLHSTGELDSRDRTVTFDLTENAISWAFSSNSSPFEITVSCPSHNAKNLTSWNTKLSKLRLLTSEISLPDLKSRRRRSTPQSTLSHFKNKGGGGRDCTKTRRGKTCCRRSLKVKFSDLRISDVIIEPQEFDAHVCVGRCNAKRVSYSTTHAEFQNILHQTKGKKVAPRPCCTPTKLTELDVIHLDPTGSKLEVTVLKDAIVEECGCS